MTHILAEWAGFLFTRELHPFALHGIIDGKCSCWRGATCDRPGKHPMRKDWQTEDFSLESTPQWANLGVRTGGDLVVLDIDDLNEAGPEDFPPTFMVMTAKGYHLYYRNRTPKRFRTMVRWRPGVDIRAEGGLVVAPPSLHISGVRYLPAAEQGRHFAHYLDIADLSDELHYSIPSQSPKVDHTLPVEWEPTEEDAPNYGPMVDLLLEEIRDAQPGERNSILFRLASRLTRLIEAGMIRPMWLTTLAEEARSSGLSDGEIARTIASASGSLYGGSTAQVPRLRVHSSPKQEG